MLRHLTIVVFLLCQPFLLTNARKSHARGEKTKAVTSSRVTSLANREWRCPQGCKCNVSSLEVNCTNTGLRSVPKDIPNPTKRLFLNYNQIEKVPLKLFKKLVNLEVLEIAHNDLDYIPDPIFRGMAKTLKRLDLSNNFIQILPRSLSRLRKLKELILPDNKLHKLQVHMFTRLRHLQVINLSDNYLQTLELKFFEKMHDLREIYLHDNLWHCDCHLKRVEEEFIKRNLTYTHVVCDSPVAMSGNYLFQMNIKSVCPTESGVLLAATVAVLAAVSAALFAIYMCKRSSAADLEVREEISAVDNLINFGKAAESASRSSVVSVLSRHSSTGSSNSNDLESLPVGDNRTGDVIIMDSQEHDAKAPLTTVAIEHEVGPASKSGLSQTSADLKTS